VRAPIAQLATSSFDLVIIGAGINGTGIARDAAARGLSVLLVDKSDIAAGTTSWSSRLIHGGLRYLEHAEISLVRESLKERERLLHIAPHLVKPLPLTLPIYKHHKRGRQLIRLGMIAYDILSYDKSLPRHRMFNAREALSHEPGLNPEALTGAARYYDAQVEFPERLALENALDAIAHGATLRTYTEVEDFQIEAGVVRGVSLLDTATGDRTRVSAKCVVNVAGPWVDEVLAKHGGALQQKRLIGATKGSHIVVDPFPGAPNDALYIEASQDGRPYFIIPWNHLYLIGTTDLRFTGDPDDVHPSEEEIAYLLKETNIAIPAAGLQRESVRYAYAGLRPLPYQEAGKEGAITRRHIIHDHAPQFSGLISIIGGKLTTYRNLSEITVDDVYRKLGLPVPKSTTGQSTLPGATIQPQTQHDTFFRKKPDWLDEQSAERLLQVYGSRANEIVAMAIANPPLRQVIHEASGTIAASVVFAVKNEAATTLHDVVFRRTMLGYARDFGRDGIAATCAILQQHCGWTTQQVEAGKAAYEAFAEASKAAKSHG
jgi:glycerol-3-phosphate dehydrogenase